MAKRSAEISEWGYVKQRSFPSLYVIDANLRVVLHIRGSRVPPTIPAYANDGVLPQLLREAVRAIRATFTKERQSGVEIIPGGSTLVHVACEERPGTHMAVFVHEYKTRDGIMRFAAEHDLTPREREVLLLLIDGHSTTSTAKLLNVANSTVLLHIKSLLTKTRSHSRTELVGKVILY